MSGIALQHSSGYTDLDRSGKEEVVVRSLLGKIIKQILSLSFSGYCRSNIFIFVTQRDLYTKKIFFGIVEHLLPASYHPSTWDMSLNRTDKASRLPSRSLLWQMRTNPKEHWVSREGMQPRELWVSSSTRTEQACSVSTSGCPWQCKSMSSRPLQMWPFNNLKRYFWPLQRAQQKNRGKGVLGGTFWQQKFSATQWHPLGSYVSPRPDLRHVPYRTFILCTG